MPMTGFRSFRRRLKSWSKNFKLGQSPKQIRTEGSELGQHPEGRAAGFAIELSVLQHPPGMHM